MRTTTPGAYGRWVGRNWRGSRRAAAVNSWRSQCDCRPRTPTITCGRWSVGWGERKRETEQKSLTTANFITCLRTTFTHACENIAAVTASVSQTAKINRELKRRVEHRRKNLRERGTEKDSTNIRKTHNRKHSSRLFAAYSIFILL